MAMPRKKPAAITWTQSLDPAAVNEAFDEVTVDAHDEDEQHSGLFYSVAEEMTFPFSARVLGETVSVIGSEWPDGNELGIDLVCERNGEQHRIEARSVELLEPLPDGHLFLAAYLNWKRFA